MLAALVAGFAVSGVQAQATKQDSGWVPLFNGKNFDGFFAYFNGTGNVDATKQDAFYVDSGMVHVPKKKASGFSTVEGHLVTFKQYSWYKVRLDYRFENGPIDNNNAGLVIHIDSAKIFVDKFKGQRPRSIEINMNRVNAAPWTLWSAVGQGPYISTTVQSGTNKFLPKKDGGVDWTNDPWGQRIIYSSYPNPESPFGQWNHGEAYVYGDSMGIFYLNGKLRTQGWDFRDRKNPNDASVANRIPVDRGEIGIQSEQQEIWYKNYEIMELEPHTLRPINAKTTALRNRRITTPTSVSALPASRFTLDGKWVNPALHGAASPALPRPQ